MTFIERLLVFRSIVFPVGLLDSCVIWFILVTVIIVKVILWSCLKRHHTTYFYDSKSHDYLS